MQAVTAPASTRTQALDIIVRRFGRPISLDKRLTEAGDAMLCCDVVSDLEVAFGIHLDDFWQPATLDQLADLVVIKVHEAMVAAATPSADVIDLAAQRARRARVPLFPNRPTIREERAFARKLRRERDRAVWAMLIGTALLCGAVAAGFVWALEYLGRGVA